MKLLITAILIILCFPISSSAALATQTKACKSDIKGYCAYSSPPAETEKGKKTNEFAAEAQSDFFVVPGLEFLNIQGGTTIGDVLIKVYTYLLGLVGISALFMFIWGGIAYTTATEGGVKEAKQKISNALFGFAIALLGYLGLITINPDFVKSLDLKLEPITLLGSSGTQELCIADSDCLDITKRCRGKWVCNADGSQKECKTPSTCDPDDNLNVCFVTVKCPDGSEHTYINTKFRSQKACQTGCAPPKQACAGFETYDIIDLHCGTT